MGMMTPDHQDLIYQFANLQKKYYNSIIDAQEMENSLCEVRERLLILMDLLPKNIRNPYTVLFILLLTKLKKSIEAENKCKNAVCEELRNYELEFQRIKYSAGTSWGEFDNKHVVSETSPSSYLYNKPKRSNFPKNISKILKSWLKNHIDAPYPTEMEKIALSDATGLDQTQINNWFINARRRLLPSLKK